MAERATLAGCGALVLWSLLGVLTRLAAPLPPLMMTAVGFGIGGVLGLGWVLARGRGRALAQPPLAWAHGVGGLFGYHALYFAALAWAPAVEANLLNYLWPLLIVLFSAPILGLKLGTRRVAGVFLGFAGCLLVAGGGDFTAPGTWPGYAAAIGAAVVWALYSVSARRLHQVPTEAVAGFCLATALLSGVGHWLFEAAVAPPAPEQWLALLALGAGPVGAAFFLWDIGMKRGDPRLLGTLAYGVPLVSTLLLVVAGEGALDERILVALGLVLGGSWLAATARDR